MLVHICCSVDSFYYLKRLRETYPDEELIGFFDNPNIHPYSEYTLRLIDARRSCEHFGILMLEGEYDVPGWLAMVRGFEQEPEKGSRCMLCFDDRLDATCRKAVELGQTRFTTTLLMSPQKDHAQLQAAARFLKKKYDVEFVFDDFRSGGGTQAQQAFSKEMGAYHQDYCGCLFALEEQRAKQERLVDEMMSPVSRQVQPGSIAQRLALYERRWEIEKEGGRYALMRERFLNWRLLRGRIVMNKTTVPSYILAYSTTRRETTRGVIERLREGVGFLNREQIKLIDCATFNASAETAYPDVASLCKAPTAFETELAVRRGIVANPYDLSAIVVVDRVAEGDRVELLLEAVVYDDTREVLEEY